MNNSNFTGSPDSLTRAEAVVLGLVDEGLSNQQISATLSITVGTVKCPAPSVRKIAGAQSHGGGSKGARTRATRPRWSVLDAAELVTFDRRRSQSIRLDCGYESYGVVAFPGRSGRGRLSNSRALYLFCASRLDPHHHRKKVGAKWSVDGQESVAEHTRSRRAAAL